MECDKKKGNLVQHDTRTSPGEEPKYDLHVTGAWRMGYNGSGVTVSILDDGIAHNHTDLAANYVCYG